MRKDWWTVGWQVRTRIVWKGITRHGDYVPTGMSHHFDRYYLTACGISTVDIKLGERKVANMTGTKPVRCKKCERALAARKKRFKRR